MSCASDISGRVVATRGLDYKVRPLTGQEDTEGE
jgi:hypothetical protein